MKPDFSKTTLFLIGLFVGIGCTILGMSVWQARPQTPESRVLLADGFRNITFQNGKFNIELVTRIDESTIEIDKVLEVPQEGFLKGYSAIEQLVDKLIEDGLVKDNTHESEEASD